MLFITTLLWLQFCLIPVNFRFPTSCLPGPSTIFGSGPRPVSTLPALVLTVFVTFFLFSILFSCVPLRGCSIFFVKRHSSCASKRSTVRHLRDRNSQESREPKDRILCFEALWISSTKKLSNNVRFVKPLGRQPAGAGAAPAAARFWIVIKRIRKQNRAECLMAELASGDEGGLKRDIKSVCWMKSSGRMSVPLNVLS